MKFIQIREEYLNLIPASVGRATRSAAAALLNYFSHQRPGWLTFNLDQLCTTLLDQWGRETVRKAAAALEELGLIERQHHRMNGRAWQYRKATQKDQKEGSLSNAEVVTAAPDKVSVTSDSATVTQNDVASIYKDPLKNQQQDPAAAVEIDFSEEIAEIEQIEVTPKISVNFQVKEAIASHPENLPNAIALVKQAVQTWEVGNKFNWTGLLVKAVKLGLEPYSAATATQKFLIPESPNELEQWCHENNARQCIWSDLEKAFKIQMSDGSWIDASSIMGVQP